MATFEINGRLHKIFETENKTPTFQAREFVIETNDNNYLQYIKFQLTQDRCQIVDTYTEGEEVKVHFDLRGREWNGKYFTNLNAWKIEKGGMAIPSTPEATDDPFPKTEFPTASEEPSFDDDLPF